MGLVGMVTDYVFAITQLAQTTLRSEVGKIGLDGTFECVVSTTAGRLRQADRPGLDGFWLTIM